MKINKRPSKKKMIIIGCSLLLVCLIAGGVYALYHQTQKNNDSGSYNPSVVKSDPNVPKPDDSKSNGGITQSQSTNTQATTPSNSTKPSDPVGIFVSSHHVSLSAGAVEQSTCSTTPGAQCQIIFSMNNTKKMLSAQTTDSNGNTQWVWNIKDIGLTAGEWTITANATIGSNVSSATDAIKLEISQ